MSNTTATKRIALVTGASKGIGRASALVLARQGLDLVLCARTEETLKATAAEIEERTGARAHAIPADVSNSEDIDRVVRDGLAEYGRLDVLVNNAASSVAGSLSQLSDDNVSAHFNVKFFAYMRFCRAVMPHLRERGYGRIINVGGTAARQVGASAGSSGPVNAAVANMSKQLANQWGPHGITVNCIHPGPTLTDRFENNIAHKAANTAKDEAELRGEMLALMPIGRIVEPEDVAALVGFLASDAAGGITGQTIAVDGGYIRAIGY